MQSPEQAKKKKAPAAVTRRSIDGPGTERNGPIGFLLGLFSKMTVTEDKIFISHVGDDHWRSEPWEPIKAIDLSCLLLALANFDIGPYLPKVAKS